MFCIVCYHVGIAPIMSAQTFPPDWRSWEGLGLNRGVFSESADEPFSQPPQVPRCPAPTTIVPGRRRFQVQGIQTCGTPGKPTRWLHWQPSRKQLSTGWWHPSTGLPTTQLWLHWQHSQTLPCTISPCSNSRKPNTQLAPCRLSLMERETAPHEHAPTCRHPFV
jgi:hypothetical protein